MENIYVQDDKERYSTVTPPEGFAANAGNTLYSWLGSLWKGLHKGDGMVKGLQLVRGERLAQLYVDIIEAARLQDRHGAPVFHMELWHPIVVRLSQRNKSQENLLESGEGWKIGPQPEGSMAIPGTVLQMGRMADFAEYCTYPVDAKIAGGAVSIVDNIVNPTVFLEKGKDFDLHEKAMIFRKDNDPLGDESKFDRYDVPGFDPSDPGRSDMEAVLWASDVMIDKDYVANHMSYVLGATSPSSDVVKRILNAAWSSVASGLTPELVRTLMAAMLNVPVIQNDIETVTDIETLDSCVIVSTDMGSYKVSPKARLRKEVYVGAVLHKGDMLDESVRIYPFLNSNRHDPFSVPLEQDIPSVVLSPGMLRARTEYGIYATWNRSKIKRCKDQPLDANGNPRLYFDMGGAKSDVSAFWQDVWEHAESEGVSMTDLLGGGEGREICPAEFMIRNLVGANTMFVVVDKSQSDDTSMMHNPMFFDMLSDVIPSAIRLFLVEHSSVGDDDRMDMGQALENESLSAALPGAVDCVSAQNPPWLEGRGASVGEMVSMRLIRPAPAKTRGIKE